MSTSIDKIEMLIQIENKTVEEARHAFQFVQNQYLSEQQQYESLKAYQAEYLASLTQPDHPIHPSQLVSKQAFLDKLNNAIKSQSMTVSDLKRDADKAQEVWIEKRARLQAFEKLLVKLNKNESKRLDKIEQRMLDELSVQTFLKRDIRE